MSQPLACSLPSDEAHRRAGQTRAVVGRSVVAREEIQGGLRLQFPGDEATEAKIREVVDAESRCCAFLSMAIERRGEEISLTVTGPPDARPVIQELFG